MKFNVNEYVLVKLEPEGIKEMKRQHDEFINTFPDCKIVWQEPTVDEDGYTKFQLHVLMNTFGHLMTLGAVMPFDSLIKLDV